MSSTSSTSIDMDVKSYSRHIDLTDAIRQILNDYPMGSGILRELLQNSDDAGASEQTLVLDTRTFGTSSLVDPVLGKYQGPALLAFNDSRFTESDWTNLSSISNSNKRDDVSKAGKFGLGFNVVHHITDAPSIISGKKLVLIDPHEELQVIGLSGGCKLDFTELYPKLHDQLSAFTSLIDNFSCPLEGTIVRLPLRTDADASYSRIKKEETTITEIRHLMTSFIRSELGISLLFLRHLKIIELREILETGESRVLARAELLGIPDSEPRPWTKSDDVNTNHLYKLCIQVTTQEGRETDNWLVRHEVGDLGRVASTVTRTSKRANLLEEEKLYPHVAVALPLSRMIDGRLFSSLPLPIETDFPVHLNALFALTTDRQSLKNPSEKAEPGSRESILQHWNTYLFQDLIPHAWAHILQDASTFTDDVYSFWAPNSDASGYWNHIDVKVLKIILESRLPVWPLYPVSTGPSILRFSRLDEALIDMSDTDPKILSAISQSGVHIIKPPTNVLHSINGAGLNFIGDNVVNPASVSNRLKIVESLQNVERLPIAQKVYLLFYFLQAKAWDQLLELPVIPRIDGSFVALGTSGNPSPLQPSVIFASDMEVKVFHSLEGRFFHRSLVETTTGHQFQPSLDFPDSFLSGTDAKHFSLADGCRLAENNGKLSVALLSKIHEWAGSRWEGHHPNSSIDCLPLPLFDASTCPTQSQPPSPPVMQSRDLKPFELEMCREFNIPLLAKGFKSTPYLEEMSRVSPRALDVEVLLQWLELRLTEITEAPSSFRNTLHGILARALLAGPGLKARWGNVLQRLPVFVAYVQGTSLRPSEHYLPFGESRFYIVDQSSKVLPIVPQHTFLDISQESNARLIRAIEPGALPSSPLELARMAVDSLHSQPEYLIDSIFKELILPQIFPLCDNHKDAFDRLRETSFVMTCNGRRPPYLLLDPGHVDMCGLFTKEEAMLPTGLYAKGQILAQLQAVSFFIKDLSLGMIEERIASYAQGRHLPQIQKCAEKLVDILETFSIGLALPKSIREQPWIPTEPAKDLAHPSDCRDESQRLLVPRDFHIMPRVLLNPRFREALGWDTEPPTYILRKKFFELVNEPPSTDQIKSLQLLVPTLAKRRLLSEEIQELSRSASDKTWIPIGNSLRPTRSVYLSGKVLNIEPSFVRLPDSLEPFSNFFLEMGVSDLPQPNDIVRVLQNLTNRSNSPSRTEHSIRLLEAISMADLTQNICESIVVPDIDGELRPLPDLIFDDRGQQDFNVHLSGNWVHPRVSSHVATVLGIRKTSSTLLDPIADDSAFSEYEQHETLQNKIQKTLLGYNYMSTCNEILANADDAQATEVTILHDKRSFSQTGALSQALHDVHGGPALVFHNNSLFTDQDWDGLSKLAEGGKGDRETIGRFGLGAVTFYHWTDVPLIVSGDVALLLDPSGVHLPVTLAGRRRLGLKINLRKCDDGRFDGVLQPLVGLFGFDPRESYGGTLIRLPLRRSKSKLLDAAHVSPDVDKFLAHCIDDARMAFLFTRFLQKISVRQGEADGSPSMVKTTTAERGEVLTPDFPVTLGNITSRDVSVNQTEVEQRYLVVNSSIPSNSLPLEIQQCARNHRLSKPSIGLAYMIPPKIQFGGKAVKHLMSTFTIGITELPVHLHGEFILSSDRTPILMDSDKVSSPSLETQYNEFLLGKLAPPAYLFLIHMCLKRGYPTLSLWPSLSHRSTEVLATALYNILPEFPEVLFETTLPNYGKEHVAPADAVFNHNARLTLFLQRMGIRNLVTKHTLSPKVVPSLQFDDGEWIRDIVLQNGDMLQSLFDDIRFRSTGFVGSLILSVESALGPEGLHGLRLLPTTRLHVFESPQEGNDPFLIPSYEELKLFDFSKDKLIDHISLRNDVIERLLLAGVSLNVKALEPKTDIRRIMAQAFPVAEGLVRKDDMGTDFDVQQWIPSLNLYITKYHVPVDELRPLPFIPLSHPERTYISADSSSSSFAVESPPRSPLLEAVKALEGFHIFSNWHELPKGLVSEPKPFNLPLFIRWLEVHSWQSLDGQTRKTLIDEVTRQLKQGNSDILLNVSSPLAKFPLWPCPSPDGTILTYKPAADVVVLPLSESIDQIDHRYLDANRYYASQTDKNLREAAKALGAIVIETPQDLGPFLSLPAHLQDSQVSSFETLLITLLVGRRGSWDHLALAPDGNLNLRLARDLFDPRVDVFSHTLDTSQLLHARFAQMAEFMIPYGLQATLVPDALEKCVRAVSRAIRNPSIGNIRERANIVYTSLDSLTSLPDSLCERIGTLAFIPRQGDDLSPTWRRQYLPRMNSVVSPSQLALQGLDRIVWTQRALFETEPPITLRNRWPSLGRPSIGEVVQHLVALAIEISPHVQYIYAHNNAFIQDLRETYDHLRDHVEDSEDVRLALSDHFSTPIFLNVEHPKQRWTWTSAENLVLDIDYDIPTQGLSHVKTFLIPYTELLVAAGVKGITRADIGDLDVSEDSPETYAQSLVIGLGKMLQKHSGENLTDITLIATDPRDGGQLRAHKVVLAATSEWFSARFSDNFQEKHTVNLDMSLRTLQAVVDHFYGRDPIPERIPLAPESHNDQEVITYVQTLLDILVAADEFMLHALSKIAEKRLLAGGGRFIRVTTAQDILRHAIAAHSEVLVQACERFIGSNASFFEY